MIIDSRNKDARGRTKVAKATAAADSKLDTLTRNRRDTIKPVKPVKGKAEPKIVPATSFDNVPPAPVAYRALRSEAASNPLTWAGYSKDVDYSISGLGATRRFKRYQGKTFMMAAAQWRESPAEADAAAKAALKALVNKNKTASGAVTSL